MLENEQDIMSDIKETFYTWYENIEPTKLIMKKPANSVIYDHEKELKSLQEHLTKQIALSTGVPLANLQHPDLEKINLDEPDMINSKQLPPIVDNKTCGDMENNRFTPASVVADRNISLFADLRKENKELKKENEELQKHINIFAQVCGLHNNGTINKIMLKELLNGLQLKSKQKSLGEEVLQASNELDAMPGRFDKIMVDDVILKTLGLKTVSNKPDEKDKTSNFDHAMELIK